MEQALWTQENRHGVFGGLDTAGLHRPLAGRSPTVRQVRTLLCWPIFPSPLQTVLLASGMHLFDFHCFDFLRCFFPSTG